eukprot:gene11678-15638_t
MDAAAVAESILLFLNKGRAASGLITLHPQSVENGACKIVNVSFPMGENDDIDEEIVNNFMQSVLDDHDKKAIIITDSRATNAYIEVDIVPGDHLYAKIAIYYDYLDLEPIGLCIDGDLVIVGEPTDSKYGIAFCVVSHATITAPDVFSEVDVVAPWKMIVMPSDNDEKYSKITVPISITNSEYHSGFLKIDVYLDAKEKIPYDDETQQGRYDMSSSEIRNILLLSNSIITKSVKDGDEIIEEERAKSRDLLSRNNSYSGDEVELEERLAGLSENEKKRDLDEEAELAYMRSLNKDDEDNNNINNQTELTKEEFVSSFFENVGEERSDVLRDVRIAFDYDEVSTLHQEGYELMSLVVSNEGTHNDRDHVWHFHVLGSYAPIEPDNEKPEYNVFVEDVMWIKCLKSIGTLPSVPFFEIIYDYDLSQIDDDKAVALMLRDKSIQSQSAAQRTAVEVVASLGDMQDNDHSIEKEKQYKDVLNLIVEERNKLQKQHREFDQLALDLQTRLDDKEFKANAIAFSFKSFKKEILLKAENSRTGSHITNKQIAQFDGLEMKREEDLEKVRLRNISLRTTFRKLERTLRAREQLAEGLHMIDFEQLKIENQTLNEKIEERNEELMKLKRKKTNTVQILTHIREKLKFVTTENKKLQMELANIEQQNSSHRNTLTLCKLSRDEIRMENKDLKQKQGFASSDLLLIDYEKRVKRNEELRANISELQERYTILLKQVNKNTKLINEPPLGMSMSQTGGKSVTSNSNKFGGLNNSSYL